MESIPVYNYNLAKTLTEEGYSIIGLGKNKNNAKLIVFYFERTEELLANLKDNHGVIWE